MCSDGMTALGAAMTALASADVDAVPDTVLADRLVTLRRCLDGLEAQWLRWLEAFDRRGGGTAAGAGGTRSWLRSACRLSPGVARARVELARALPGLPDTAAALSAGQITVTHAQQVATAVAELAEALGAEAAAEVEPALVDVARAVDPGRLRHELAHARHALAPQAAADAAERAYERRRLSASETLDGMVAVDGMLDPEGGAVLLAALMPMSTPADPDDRRTPPQRRADALVELARQHLDRGNSPIVGGERPHLTVLVPLETLQRPVSTGPVDSARPGEAAANPGTQPTGQPTTDPPATHTATSHGIPPGQATGGSVTQPTGRPNVGARAADTLWAGPVTGEAARRLACDAGITRVITGGASQPLDVGRRTRTIPPALRTALVVRDRGCAFPRCDRPPPWTDAHHVISWVDGGATALDNLILLCRRHHRAVHEGHWHLSWTPDGRWTAAPPSRRAPPGPPRAA